MFYNQGLLYCLERTKKIKRNKFFTNLYKILHTGHLKINSDFILNKIEFNGTNYHQWLVRQSAPQE